MKTTFKILIIICFISYYFLGCEGISLEKLVFVKNEKIGTSRIYKSSVKNIFQIIESEINRWDWVYVRGEDGLGSRPRDIKFDTTNKNTEIVKKSNIAVMPDNSSHIHIAKKGSKLRLIAGNSRII